MLDKNGLPVDKKDLAAAGSAREFVERCIREMTTYAGKRPTVVRVSMKRYLILVQVGWVDSWPGVEVKAA